MANVSGTHREPYFSNNIKPKEKNIHAQMITCTQTAASARVAISDFLSILILPHVSTGKRESSVLDETRHQSMNIFTLTKANTKQKFCIVPY